MPDLGPLDRPDDPPAGVDLPRAPLVGVVVVTHGQLATELVNAAEMIVGELSGFVAVSIGWHDDVETAREAIAAAISRVARPAGVIVLTDMFGGTPANLGLPFLAEAEGRGDHRRQPADAAQAGRAAAGGQPAARGAADARERPQRDLGGLRPDARDAAEGRRRAAAAGGRAGVTSRAVVIGNSLGLHARAAARFVHLAGTFGAQVLVDRAGRTIDGKSIMGLLLLAAARGTSITISADGPDEDAAVGALSALVERGFDEDSACSVVTGIGVAPGIAEGRALVVRTRRRDVRYLVAADRVRAELSRLTDAQGRSRRQLEAIRARLTGVAGQGAASLFEAQLLMIDDAMLVGRAAAFVRDERRNAEWALRAAADELVAVIGAAGDPYLRERHGDVRDVVERLVGNLRWESRGIVVPEGSDPWVLVADELAPSTVAQVDWSRAAGFVTEGGSWASHTAILARSLGVPRWSASPGRRRRFRPARRSISTARQGSA